MHMMDGRSWMREKLNRSEWRAMSEASVHSGLLQADDEVILSYLFIHCITGAQVRLTTGDGTQRTGNPFVNPKS